MMKYSPINNGIRGNAWQQKWHTQEEGNVGVSITYSKHPPPSLLSPSSPDPKAQVKYVTSSISNKSFENFQLLCHCSHCVSPHSQKAGLPYPWDTAHLTPHLLPHSSHSPSTPHLLPPPSRHLILSQWDRSHPCKTRLPTPTLTPSLHPRLPSAPQLEARLWPRPLYKLS